MRVPFIVVCVAFQLLTFLFHRDACGQLYWTHETISGSPLARTSIHQANLDGSNDVLLIPFLNHPRDVVVDREAGTIYWTESIGDRIARANLDGSGVQTILSINDPESLAIDFSVGKMYWGGIGLYVANVDGTGVTLLAGGGEVVTSVAVASTTQTVYYADHFGNRIGRVPASGGGADFFINSLPAHPNAIAVDEERAMIYWSDLNENIWKQNLIDGTARSLLYSDAHFSRDIFIDPVDERLWWTWEGDDGTSNIGGISNAPLDGSGPISTFSVPFRPTGIWVESIPEPQALALAMLSIVNCMVLRRHVPRGRTRCSGL